MCNCEANKLKIDKIYNAVDDGVLSIAVKMLCECGTEHCYKISYSREKSSKFPEPDVVDRSYTCLQ